jgi:hypothetical protein
MGGYLPFAKEAVASAAGHPPFAEDVTALAGGMTLLSQVENGEQPVSARSLVEERGRLH